MNFSSQIFYNDFDNGYRASILKENYLWLLPFYIVAAAYCYYEKLRRTLCAAIVLPLLKPVSKMHSIAFRGLTFVLLVLNWIFYESAFSCVNSKANSHFSVKTPHFLLIWWITLFKHLCFHWIIKRQNLIMTTQCNNEVFN